MGIDLSKIKIAPQKRSRLTDPLKIFESLTLRGTVENIWGPQVEALKVWDTKRTEADLIIEMNTGGGKTLVGLLIAQALVNETQRQIIYVCPTNQLVEQVWSKASECSIEAATYMKGHWAHGEVYDEARGPCITNYAAVFNGRSIFKAHNIGGIIFDDAHVADNTIRTQFSLKFSQEHEVFSKIIALFKAHFDRNSQTQELQNAIASDWQSLLFVPMFEVHRNAYQLTDILLKNGVMVTDDTKFAWEHLKSHLDRCVILISGAGIEISPASLPLHRLPCFSAGVRRIYLTATLPSSTEFVRTFGVANPTKIQPGGKSGEAQRLFVFMKGDTEEQQRESALKLVTKQKACIISPSSKTATFWSSHSTIFDSNSGHAGIETFAKSKGNDKLVLVARYDGIDLPGDACQIMILDGMPLGISLLDRFIDQSLQIEALRSARTAVRLIQAIGRIFRSNTDHGIVILSGTELQSWLRNPHNQSFLPHLLQKQIQLGLELRKAVDSKETTFTNLIKALLTGDKGWDRLYQQHVDEFDTSSLPEPPGWLNMLVARERSAYAKLWEGNWSAAAKDYSSLAEEAEKHDPRLAAWYHHWEGFAYDFGNDRSTALHAYLVAVNVRSELGRPKIDDKSIIASATVGNASPQALKMANLYEQQKAKTTKRLEQICDALEYGSDTKPAEQALSDLGEFLGLEATRPDTRKREKTGPDVLWRYPSSSCGVALELKTNKPENSHYQKKNDIGQFHDHIKYLTERYPKERFLKVIVGRNLPVSTESHPPDDLKIIALEQFESLTHRAKELYENVAASENRENTATCIQRWLNHLGLNWPNCVANLQSTLAIDLKVTHPDTIVGE